MPHDANEHSVLEPVSAPEGSATSRKIDSDAETVGEGSGGFLGGVVGLILGALRMPALLRFVGAEPVRAIGTNLLVGVCVGAAGLVAHTPSGVDWTLFAVGAAASIPGALLGARLTGRLDEQRLLQAVGAILVAAGTAAILQGTL